MRTMSLSLALVIVVCGCGGPAPRRTEADEVPATWTAGDDAPLEGERDGDAERGAPGTASR